MGFFHTKWPDSIKFRVMPFSSDRDIQIFSDCDVKHHYPFALEERKNLFWAYLNRS